MQHLGSHTTVEGQYWKMHTAGNILSDDEYRLAHVIVEKIAGKSRQAQVQQREWQLLLKQLQQQPRPRARVFRKFRRKRN